MKNKTKESTGVDKLREEYRGRLESIFRRWKTFNGMPNAKTAIRMLFDQALKQRDEEMKKKKNNTKESTGVDKLGVEFEKKFARRIDYPYQKLIWQFIETALKEQRGEIVELLENNSDIKFGTTDYKNFTYDVINWLAKKGDLKKQKERR